MPWTRVKVKQLNLLDADDAAPTMQADVNLARIGMPAPPTATRADSLDRAKRTDGLPLMVPIERVVEDEGNPRTEMPDAELTELADDIAQRGILQPLVVHLADASGRYRVHFGARRLRAAMQAGLHEVPIVIRDLPADPYAQVAENLRRSALSPMELARSSGRLSSAPGRSA